MANETVAMWYRLLIATTVLVASAAAALGAVRSAHDATSTSPELPHLGRVPTFAMRNQEGKQVLSAELQGRVVLLDFFYASCTTSCPRLTAEMLYLARAFHEEQPRPAIPLHLVSITLDPANDTPEALADYAKRYGVSAGEWSFLSGRDEDLNRVVVDGFKVHFQRVDPELGLGTIMHGEWLVLIDAAGDIRGYYQAGDSASMRELLEATRQLTSVRPKGES